MNKSHEMTRVYQTWRQKQRAAPQVLIQNFDLFQF